VAVADRVSLVPYTSGTPQLALAHTKFQLHLSHMSLADFPEGKEVNCLNEPTSWQVLLFLQFDENLPDILKSVRSFFLKNLKTDGWLLNSACS
jgi:hypothetical protein